MDKKQPPQLPVNKKGIDLSKEPSAVSIPSMVKNSGNIVAEPDQVVLEKKSDLDRVAMPQELEKLIPTDGSVNVLQNKTSNKIPQDVLLEERNTLQEAHARTVRECQEIYDIDTPRHLNYLLYIIVIFFAAFLLWAQATEIDETTEGFGEVIPSSKVQIVQNLEGGIISAIHVQEGDMVKKGDKLVSLSSTLFGASYKEQHRKYLSLLGNIARLHAQVNMLDIVVFPQELDKYVDIKQHEQRLFETNIQALTSELTSLQESLKLINNEIDITQPLVDAGLMSKLDRIRLEKERSEKERQVQEKKANFIAGSHAELNAKQSEIASLSESLKGLHDRMARTTVTAPTNGIIHNLRVSTIGGVVSPGMEIVDIVPMEDGLLIEAKIRPMDIAFIHPGQPATVKVTAYDYSTYGGLFGQVVNISPDTVTDEKGNKFYEITIKTDKNFLGDKAKPLPIIPGMLVTVHILTGKKSIMTYVFRPIFRIREDAFRER